MPATSANSRSTGSTRSRLPLTPSVVSSRRGGHATTRPATARVQEPAPVAATPAMHITPNVVSAVRGGLTLSSKTRLSDAFNAGALDMRGLRF